MSDQWENLGSNDLLGTLTDNEQLFTVRNTETGECRTLVSPDGEKGIGEAISKGNFLDE